MTINTESRFNAANYSEPLTAFSSGLKDPENLKETLEFIAPSIPVGHRFEFKKTNNAQAFLSETDDIRAIGSSFKQVEYSGESVNEKTINKGLSINIDHDEVVGNDWQERYVQLLIQRLYRNELNRAIEILDLAATHETLNWKELASPDADLRRILSDATGKSRIRPNRILFGESAWDARATVYEGSTALHSLADLSPEDLAKKLLVREIKITHASNDIYTYFAQSAITKDEPSNLKRFFTPIDGNPFRVYLEEHAKYTTIAVEHYSNIVVTSHIGIHKCTIQRPVQQ